MRPEKCGGGEGEILGSRGEAPVSICKRLIIDGLCWPDDVNPVVVEVCTAS